MLKHFSRPDCKIGGNLLTLTAMDLETMENATKHPELYDLLRVRTGGWSEFFSTFFEAHKEQHKRRVFFFKDEETTEDDQPTSSGLKSIVS